MRKVPVETRLDEETIDRIDRLIKKKVIDSRASFLRRAALEKLDRMDKPILS